MVTELDHKSVITQSLKPGAERHKRMTVSKISNQLVEKIILYFKSKPEVIAVYLFGSYAHGLQRHLSDIDIGILLDRKVLDDDGRKIREYMTDLPRVFRKDVHPVILNTAGEELLKQIFKKGRCLLINDSKKLARYKMVMFANIADFSYYRIKMQSGLIRKIMKG
jgi:hypothetical protein